jgi:uncharacterized membrane protein YvbJ
VELGKSYNFCFAIAYLEEAFMSICPQCGDAVSADAVVCGSCDTVIMQNNGSQLQAVNGEPSNAEMNVRLQKALRRTELLSYATAGLGLAIFAVIILISFL